MAGGIQGRFEGEGPNVSGALNAAVPGDVPTTNVGGQNGPLGNTQSVAIDRRRRIRVSNEAGRQAITINYSADQIFTKATRWLYVAVTGTLVVRFADDSADVTLANLPVGLYQFAISIIRNSGSSGVTGVAIF